MFQRYLHNFENYFHSLGSTKVFSIVFIVQNFLLNFLNFTLKSLQFNFLKLKMWPESNNQDYFPFSFNNMVEILSKILLEHLFYFLHGIQISTVLHQGWLADTGASKVFIAGTHKTSRRKFLTNSWIGHTISL